MSLELMLNYLNKIDSDVQPSMPFFYDVPECFNYDKSISGFKISLQGKNIDDSIYLLTHLYPYLEKNEIPFKSATKNRFHINEDNIIDNKEVCKEQAFKAMTIYIPSGIDLFDVCSDIKDLLVDYNGWDNVKHPTSYTQYYKGIYYRKDTDENGNYISAN